MLLVAFYQNTAYLKLPTVYTRLETRRPPATNEDRCEVTWYYSLGREDGGLWLAVLILISEAATDT